MVTATSRPGRENPLDCGGERGQEGAMYTRTGNPTVGVVIPCFNEEEVIPHLAAELTSFISRTPFEVTCLFVDDGSTDRTFELLSELCRKDDRFGCLRFSRNFGHQAAVSAGLQRVEGDAVAVIDADLQDPLEVIPRMVEKWREGYDVVFGVRRERKEGFLLRSAYAIFYRLLRRVANIDLPLDAGDFSLMDRRVVDVLAGMKEQTHFMRGLRGWVGFRQVGLPYERSARVAGKPKYNLKRLTRLAVDGLVSFSSVPLRLASWLGAISSLIGFVLIMWAVISSLVLNRTPPGWASLAVILLFFGGIQLLVLGIIGEYLGRVFEEVKGRPVFIVADQVGRVRGG